MAGMYFDIAPKTKKEDFFNYDYEHSQVRKAMDRKDAIIAVLGTRRVGKTTLLSILYNETKALKVWIDGRILSDPKTEVHSAIYEAVKANESKIFGSVEGFSVSAFGIGIGLKAGRESRAEMERKIKGTPRVFVFIDEAQQTRRKDLASVLSYFYDRIQNVSFIISGSEIGLVEEVMGENNPEHPLYGRNIVKVAMGRLDRSKAMEFLKKGFGQLEMNVEESEIEDAIGELDGLIGWLTLYGYRRGLMKSQDALAQTIQTAAQITRTEFLHFLKKRKNGRAYACIIRRATGVGWTELKALVERDLKESLDSNQFTFLLDELLKYSFLEKKEGKYQLADPLLFKASL
jgi:AAA+ ATPase superfamily predicted ATPase